MKFETHIQTSMHNWQFIKLAVVAEIQDIQQSPYCKHSKCSNLGNYWPILMKFEI